MLVHLSDRGVMEIMRSPGDLAVPLYIEWQGSTLQSVNTRASNDCSAMFPVIEGQPVLIDFQSSIFERDWYDKPRQTYSHIGRKRNFWRQLKGAITGSRRISAANYKKFGQLIKETTNSTPLVLMVGASTRGIGSDVIYEDKEIRQIAFDVYPSSHTTFIADAHKIPLADASVEGVCIQAVLEHVLDPQTVVAEIYRVLKPNGIVYAETPFMQQVHEAAYDFTRFTELGHRWLWRNFEAVERGSIGGPGLSAYWAMKYLLSGLTRSRKFGNLLSIPFAALALLDRFVPNSHAIDGANGVYFMGQKSETTMAGNDLLSSYLGAQ